MPSGKRVFPTRRREGFRRCTGRCAAVGLGLALAACSDAGPETVLSIEAPASTDMLVGAVLTLSATASGDTGPLIWSTSDPRIATVVGGTVEALRPGVVRIEVAAPNVVPDDVTLTVRARPNGYAADEIDYFTEIAFGSEFGGATPLLRRWREGSGPLVRVNGSPTNEDREVVDSAFAEINRLAPVDIEIVADFPTVELHFVPQAEFDEILPQAPPGNVGLVWLWWDAQQYLYQSVVLIATDISPALRAHIIREELTQMLGLLQDSFRYPASIFYQQYSEVTEYLAIDRAVIELLYRPELSVGMTPDAAARVARTLERVGPYAGTAAPSRTPRPDRATAGGRPGSGGSGGFSASRFPLRRVRVAGSP
ncbi:MAG: DUF2927 domain-containing protein [Gemmatimonadota bacterium]|nr:DUF2927 domain-containing protein [Gemmatimonadota bacterium]MDH3423891.1 DUF2927 domain-containing protein [Gemmatimonadota bacterium]